MYQLKLGIRTFRNGLVAIFLLTALTGAFAIRPMTGPALSYSNAVLESLGVPPMDACPEKIFDDVRGEGLCALVNATSSEFRKRWDLVYDVEAKRLGFEIEVLSDWKDADGIDMRFFTLDGANYTVAYNSAGGNVGFLLLRFEPGEISESKSSSSPAAQRDDGPHNPNILNMLPYQVVERVDESKGSRFIAMQYNALIPADLKNGLFFADLYFFESPTIDSLSFAISYYAERPMLIKEGASLLLTVDGQEFALMTNRSIVVEETDGAFYENAYYTINREQIRQIGNARKVQITIEGFARDFDRELSAENKQRFKDFYETYLQAEENVETTASTALPKSAPALAADQSYAHDPDLARKRRYEVSQNSDRAGTLTTFTMNNAVPPSSYTQGILNIDLALVEFASANILELGFSYISSSPMGLLKGASLIFTVDGETLEFTTNQEVITSDSGGFSFEHVSYDISPESVRRIANGNDVRVQIFGRERSFDRVLDNEVKQRFKDFYDSYLRGVKVTRTPRVSPGLLRLIADPKATVREADAELEAIIERSCQDKNSSRRFVDGVCVGEQNRAAATLVGLIETDGGISSAAFDKAFEACYSQWPEDFRSQLYCLERELDAYGR